MMPWSWLPAITRHEEELIGMAALYIHEKECYVDSIHIKR